MKKSIISTVLASVLLISPLAHADEEFGITPGDAFDWASSDASAYILDVRTVEEYYWVGHPGPNGLVGSKKGNAHGLNYHQGAFLEEKVVNIPFRFGMPPAMVPNDDFVGEVKAGFEPDDVLLVLCRSGGRAAAAAEDLREEGYEAYYIIDGFQGPKNDDTYPGPDTGYRDVSGWVNEGLPWNQSLEGIYDPE